MAVSAIAVQYEDKVKIAVLKHAGRESLECLALESHPSWRWNMRNGK